MRKIIMYGILQHWVNFYCLASKYIDINLQKRVIASFFFFLKNNKKKIKNSKMYKATLSNTLRMLKDTCYIKLP